MGEAIAAGGPPDPAVVAALAAEHGLEMVDVPWIDDVVARYNLTPPPGGRQRGRFSQVAFRDAPARVADFECGAGRSPLAWSCARMIEVISP